MNDSAKPIHRDYADWKAPAGDGELLIWPDLAQMAADARANQSLLGGAHNSRLLGVPVSEIRRQTRAWLGQDPHRLLFLTGHQTELHHPGVWVKNAVIDAAAREARGEAYHIAVDTDSPKHLMLRWPGGEIPATDDARLGTLAWAGALAPPSPSHIQAMHRAVSAAAGEWAFRPVIFDLLDSLTRLSLEVQSLSSALCNATHELDWSLGLRHHAMLASPIWASPPFLLLAASIIARAGEFASHYNAALHEYRDEHGLDTNSRPMPDLFVHDQSVEIPFWLDELSTGRRTRPSAFRVGESFALQLVNGEEIEFSPGENGWDAAHRLERFLAGTGHRLSPRALMLTLFLRLFAADQFVHGIGGGRYDQVLDKLIHRSLAIEPPKFAVATATLLFPTAVGRSRACVRCVLREGHRLKHSVLGERKRELVAQIASHPRRSRQRALVFSQMQTELREAWKTDGRIADWRDRLEQVRRQEQRDAIEFDRELFYALQPRDRLEALVHRVTRRM